MASIILDDTTPLLSLTGDDIAWSRVQVERYFNGSAVYPPFSCDAEGETGSFGSLSITFQGTSISFIGNTPPLFCSQNILVSIDGGTPYNTSYSDPSPPSARQWYRSPTLSDALHSMDITRIAGVSIDFMVITAGPKTPLSGQRLIVDDDDPAIVYSQHWNRKTGIYRSKDPPIGLPYGNTTHQSSTSGSSAIFQFAGTSVAVYSLFDYSHLGDLSVLYTLDSTRSLKSYSVTKTTQSRTGVLQRENVLIFSSDGLSSGVHTLTMEVKNNTNQAALSIDYILYTPSFDTLSEKPEVSHVSLIGSDTSTLPTTVTGSLTASGVSNTLPLTVTPMSGVRPTTSTGITPGSSTHKSTPIGAIVGGVVGGMALFILLLLKFLCKKRLARCAQSSSSLPFSFSTQGPRSIVPFTSIAAGPDTHDKKSAEELYYSATLQASLSEGRSRNGNVGIGNTTQGPQALLHQGSDPPDATSQPNTEAFDAGGSGVGIILRSRTQRLQDLVSELNREAAQNGEHSMQGAVLRGRIAELSREDAEIGARDGITVPPPYEPRRRSQRLGRPQSL